MQELFNIFKSVFFTFFPRKCIFCGGLLTSDEKLICNHCNKLYPYPTDFNREEFFAPLMKYISGICILGYYSYVGNAVKDFKFRENIRLGKQLAELLCKKLENETWINSVDYIVPVPLHRKKLRKRGFNQSEIISNVIAKRFNKKVISGNLIRKVNTKSQHESNGSERYYNVKGVFTVKNPSLFCAKNVLLVDDVITTCATVAECCKEMYSIDGIKIYVCVLASDRQII